jgi:hypothetical protein
MLLSPAPVRGASFRLVAQCIGLSECQHLRAYGFILAALGGRLFVLSDAER